MRISNGVFLIGVVLALHTTVGCACLPSPSAPTTTPWVVTATPLATAPATLSPPTPQAGEPQVNFSADRLTLNPGECATLQWSVQGRGAFGQILDGQSVNNAGQKQVCPRETTVYRLGVDVGTTMLQREVTISVAGSPRAGSTPLGQVQIVFTANRTTLSLGECATLQWSTQGVIEFVELEGQRVANAGEKQVCPAQTAAYTLMVGSGVTFTRQVTLTVESGRTASTPIAPTPPGCAGPPTIAFFNASPPQILPGQTSTLSWGAVTNATSATINQGIGGVATPGSIAVKPASTTTYTLTASGCGGAVTRQVTIQVASGFPTLVATVFPTVTPGTSVTSTVLTPTPIVPHLIQADLQVTDIFPETLPQGKVFFRVTNHGPDALTNAPVPFACTEERQPVGGGAISASGASGAIIITLKAGQTGVFDAKLSVNTNQFRYYFVCVVTYTFDPKANNNSYGEKIPP